LHAGIKFIPLALAGIAAMVWGLPAAYTLKRPYDIAAAIAALAGLSTMLLGILLAVIPDFFR